jgi:hypothetical protein
MLTDRPSQMLMAEGGTAPSQSSLTWNPSCHGTSGPISVQYDPSVFVTSPALSTFLCLTSRLQQSSETGEGLQHDDAQSRTAVRVRSRMREPERRRAHRKHASRRQPRRRVRRIPRGQKPVEPDQSVSSLPALRAKADRGGTAVLAGAQVGKVLLSADATPRATGVEFQDQSGNTYTVSANLEVLVATGSVKTPGTSHSDVRSPRAESCPAILQYSGIGPSAVLRAAGIAQRVNLPVGQNLIDQTTSTTNWQFKNAEGGGQARPLRTLRAAPSLTFGRSPSSSHAFRIWFLGATRARSAPCCRTT